MDEGANLPHPDLLHHRFRGNVGVGAHREDFVESQRSKREFKASHRCFGRVAFSPSRFLQSPADVNARRKRALVSLMQHANEAKELTATQFLNREVREAMFVEVLLVLTNVGGGIFFGNQIRKMPHHVNVLTQFRERSDVAVDPVSQTEPFGLDGELVHGWDHGWK